MSPSSAGVFVPESVKSLSVNTMEFFFFISSKLSNMMVKLMRDSVFILLQILTHAFISDTSTSNGVIMTICFKINHFINLLLLEKKCH